MGTESNVAKLAREAVERIIRDLTGRRGFKALWSDLDPATRDEIKREWTRLAADAFAGESERG